MNAVQTLKFDEYKPDKQAPAADGLAELREHWPALADPVRDAVLTLVRSAAGKPAKAVEGLPLLLGVDHLTGLLGVCRTTIDRMDEEGRLPSPMRAGRAKKWERDDFLAWLKARKPDSKPFTRAEWARLPK